MPAKVTEVHPGIFEIFLPLPMRPTIINVYLINCGREWTADRYRHEYARQHGDA